MEAISVIASVGSLVQGTNYFVKILGSLKNGGKDRKRLLLEVDNLTAVLERLKVAGDSATKSDRQKAGQDILACLSGLGDTLERIDDVICKIKIKIEPKTGFRGSLRKWAWPFYKEDVDRNVNQMQRLSQNVSMAMNVASLKLALDTKEHIANVDAVAKRRELRAILELLSPMNFFRQQQLQISEACPGTYEWFLSSPQYRFWKDYQQRVLHCYAIGGAGKTILASAAIQDLCETAGQDVAIFTIYCSHERPDTHSVDKLALTMLRQLIEIKLGMIPPDLESLLERHYDMDRTKPDFGDILKVINTHIPTFSKAFIVVDGLDEIIEPKAREEIIAFFMRLEGPPQILFTSRPMTDINNIFLPIPCGTAETGQYCQINDGQ
jgi:hypothetical protein